MRSVVNEVCDADIKEAIRAIFSALTTDFGSAFLAQFNESITPDAWKWGLYKRLDGCSALTILEGFELLNEQLHEQRMPTVDEIVLSIRSEQHRLSELPDVPLLLPEVTGNGDQTPIPARIAEVVDAFEKVNTKNTPAMNTISELRSVLTMPAHSAEQMESKLSSHSSLLKDHRKRGRIRQVLFHDNPICSAPNCAKPGTMSTSTNGTSDWFCRKHLRQR